MDRIVNHSNPCLKSQPPTSWKTRSSLSGNALSKYLTVFIHIFSNHFRSYPLPQRRVYSIPHGRIAKNITSVGGLGEVDDSDVAQLPGLPWVFDEWSGELQHFLADLSGRVATADDFSADAAVFERCFHAFLIGDEVG